jgi:hypothetical protein
MPDENVARMEVAMIDASFVALGTEAAERGGQASEHVARGVFATEVVGSQEQVFEWLAIFDGPTQEEAIAEKAPAAAFAVSHRLNRWNAARRDLLGAFPFASSRAAAEAAAKRIEQATGMIVLEKVPLAAIGQLEHAAMRRGLDHPTRTIR